MPTCAIIVPCYNEAARLPVEVFATYIPRHPNLHFVFVNDGSTDATSTVLKSLQSRIPTRITVLDNTINQGKAGVVRQGLLHALDNTTLEHIGFWDADLATPLETIEEMLSILAERPQVWMVFGARVQLLGRHIERKTHRHYLGRVFATIVSIMLGLPIYDSQCGAKLFRRTPHTRSLFAKPFVSRWVFDVEILARFLRLPNTQRPAPNDGICEYPLPIWRDIDGSKVKPLDFFRALMDLFKIGRDV